MTDSTPPAVPEPTPAAETPTAPPAYQAPAAAPVNYAPAAPWNVLSIVSLVAAILAGFGLVAVITGHIALNQIKKTGEQGKVLAIIGLVLGYLEIIGGIIAGILIIVFSIAAVNAGYNY